MLLKDSILSIVRMLLTLLGGYIIGHNIFGTTVIADSHLADSLIGVVLSLGTAIWGIFDKSSTIDQLQSAVRSGISVVGGIFTAAGKISGDTLNTLLGLVGPIFTVVQSYTAKLKVSQIADGKLSVSASGKTVTNVPPKNPDPNQVANPKQ